MIVQFPTSPPPAGAESTPARGLTALAAVAAFVPVKSGQMPPVTIVRHEQVQGTIYIPASHTLIIGTQCESADGPQAG